MVTAELKEFRVWCGNYRHFIVTAYSPEDAKRIFQLAYEEDTMTTKGFSGKDVTRVEENS